MAKKLTERREYFAQLIAKGRTPDQAYLQAYPSSKKFKGFTFKQAVKRMMGDLDVLARIDELTGITESNGPVILLWSKDIATRELLRIVHGQTEEPASNRDVVSAIIELNRLHELHRPDDQVSDLAQLIIDARTRVHDDNIKTIEGERVESHS